MAVIGLELVPTSAQGGAAEAQREAERVKELLQRSGLGAYLNTLVVPQIVPEDGGRPVRLDEKLDPLEFRWAVTPVLPLSFLLTQVTVSSTPEELDRRVGTLAAEGIDRVVFIGAPRNTGTGPVAGPRPEEALRRYQDVIPHRGVILIPTREGEEERFHAKVQAGATFALTQMLFNGFAVDLLQRMAEYPERPEILLSFGYVPKIERKRGLLRWLVQHKGPDNVAELEALDGLIDLSFRAKKARLVENYKRIVEGVAELGFPVGVHFECPYGVSEPAFEAFAEMVNAWSPEREVPARR